MNKSLVGVGVLALGLAASAASWAQSCPGGFNRVTGGSAPAVPGGGSFLTFITGATICATRGTDRWQEFHDGSLALFDWKRGPGHAVDPREQVGTWAATNGSNSTLTHTYSGTSFAWAICLPVGATAPFVYRMESPTGGTITNVSILAGSTACP